MSCTQPLVTDPGPAVTGSECLVSGTGDAVAGTAPGRAARIRRRALAATTLLALAGSAGCTSAAKTPETPSPFAACSALTADRPPPAADVPSSPARVLPSSRAVLPSSPAALPSSPGAVASSTAGGPPAPAAGPLPDLRLPCFTGGGQVDLRRLRGPAVINLWASWCPPCRDELPVMQRLADRTGDQLTVLGVDTGDGREAAASFAVAKGITMPTLFDTGQQLQRALAVANLPATVFVDAAGRSYVNRLPLDEAKLTELVRIHTGVAVPQ